MTNHSPRDKLGSPIALPQLFAPLIKDSDDLKAVKVDDIKVKTYIRDERVVDHFAHLQCDDLTMPSLNRIRSITTRWWTKSVWNSFFRYLDHRYGVEWLGSRTHRDRNSELNGDIEVFCDCSFVVRNTSRFDWDAGSVLFFWRWPRPYLNHARDVIPTWFPVMTSRILFNGSMFVLTCQAPQITIQYCPG